MSRRIVQRYLSSDGFPERAPGSGRRSKGKSQLDPYLVYLRERWNEGLHSGSRLFCEIKERGYTGSASLLIPLLSHGEETLVESLLFMAGNSDGSGLTCHSHSFFLPPERSFFHAITFREASCILI